MIDRLHPAGTEKQLLATIRTLDRRRIEPHLVLLDGDDEISRSMEPHDCPTLRLGVRRLRKFSSLGRARKLGDFLRQQRIDVFQPHFPDSTYFGVPVARWVGVRRIVLTRRDTGYWVTAMHRCVGPLVSRLAHAALANSEGARESLIRDDRVDPSKVTVIENGVDMSRFANIEPGLLGDPCVEGRVVGLVANLRPVKDPDLFLHAASKLLRHRDDVLFRIAGEGELRPGLEQLARNLGIQERVEFAGTVSDMAAFLAKLDVAVLCSRTEGLSNALLEYMAAGRAIVATAVGGNTRLIGDGVEGILVPPGDADALAKATGWLLSHPSEARSMAAAARAKASRQFSLEAHAKRLEDYYLSILSQPRHEPRSFVRVSLRG
jgi:glycosyltransferase involved in cell wall biosynthesis